MTKFCNGCKTEKPRTEFTTRRAAPDGLKPRCRACVRLEERRRYHRDPDATRAKVAASYQRDKDKLKRRRDEYRAANPSPGRTYARLPPDERDRRKKEARKRTYEKNKASVLATAARYRAQNREKERADRKAHYERNKAKTAEVCRAYRQANKGKVAAWQKQYQTRKKKALPSWADLQKIAEIYETAAWLTEQSGEPWHVDHIVPLQGKTVCGLHVENNLALLTAPENLTKSNRWWPDMFDVDPD